MTLLHASHLLVAIVILNSVGGGTAFLIACIVAIGQADNSLDEKEWWGRAKFLWGIVVACAFNICCAWALAVAIGAA
jgi:hypothetical protein